MMNTYQPDTTFIPEKALKQITATADKPFVIYDERGIREKMQTLRKAFGFAKQYRQFFPMRAYVPAQLLLLLKELGCGVCCYSGKQLALCAKLGFDGAQILYAPATTDPDAEALAHRLGCTFVICAKHVLPQMPPKHAILVCNPKGKFAENGIVYTSFDRVKWGLDEHEIAAMAENLLRYGTESVGLMLPACTFEIRQGYFPAVTRRLFSLAATLHDKGIKVSVCSLAGGFAHNPKPEGASPDILQCGEEIRALAGELLPNGADDLCVDTLLGQYLLAPHAIFLAPVRAVVKRERPLLLVDIPNGVLTDCQPLGTYYHISALGKTSRASRVVTDVSDCDCELRRLLADGRILPAIKEGDWLVFHTAGLAAASLCDTEASDTLLYGMDSSITAW